MESIMQIHNVTRKEFISIIENVIETKLSESKENDKPSLYSVKEVANLLSVSEILEKIFEGYKIAIVTKNGLSKYIGPYILKEIEYV